MWHIHRTSDPADLIEGVKFVSFVGGGGKTTLTECLASALRVRNRSVAIATTTKIRMAEPFITFDEWLKKDEAMPFVHVGKTAQDGKLTGLTVAETRLLGERFDTVLIEADGAKGLPLKYPADREPVIPEYSDRVFIVAGLDSLFRPFTDVVFRHELFAERRGTPPRLVYPDVFADLFTDDALLKGTQGLERTVVLNKYDACKHRHLPALLMQKILEQTGITKGLVTAARFGVFYQMRSG